MKLGVRTLIFPNELEKLTDGGYDSMGRLIRSAFIRKLTEDKVLDKVKSEGVAVEVYLKDITKKERKQYKEDK